MRLDDGETLELDTKPDKKVLTVWFFSKTITYSIAVVFFAFMLLFVTNTIEMASNAEVENKSELQKTGSESNIL